VPASHRPYTVEGKNGQSFSKDIKDLILFEYHDILHANAVPDADVIVARDVLSYLSADDQARVLDEFEEKVKGGGVLILGANERLPRDEGWVSISTESVTAYRRK
jgi:purine-binding chemotaxis protein CheW